MFYTNNHSLLVTKCNPQSRAGEFNFHLFEGGKCLRKLLGILLYGIKKKVGALTYSIIYCNQYVFREIYFTLWVIIQYDVTYFCSACSSVGHWVLFQVGSCIFWPSPYSFGVWALSYFLAYKMFPAHLHLPCPSPRIRHSLRSFTSFCWRMVLETKIWVLGVLRATGASLLLGPFIRQS